MNADLVELRTMRRRANVLKDGYEQVEQQNVGKEQVNAKHDDGEPLGEGGHLVVVQHRTLWLQTIRAVDAARLDVKCSICLGRSVLGFRPRYLISKTVTPLCHSQSMFVGKSPNMMRYGS